MRRGFLRLATAAGLLFLVQAPSAWACTCSGNPDFYEVARHAPVLVRAVVLEHKSIAVGYRPNLVTHIEVRVLDVLAGVVPNDRILIAGDVGNLCRPYVSGFAVGTEWFFVLSPRAALHGDVPEFAISICGTHWMRVTDDTRDAIAAKIRSVIK